MKKMHACIINIYGYPLYNQNYHGSHGGAEVDLFLLAKELSNDDTFCVSVLTGTAEDKAISEDYDKVKVLSVFRIGVPRSLKGIMIALMREMKFFNLLRKVDADVYIQEAAGYVTGIVAFYCWLFKKKFVYRAAHDNDCNKHYIKTAGAMGKLYWYGLTHASSVIAQNERQQEILKKYHNIEAPIIGNAHHVPKQPNVAKDTVLWIARCEKWKRPELFLDIVKAFPQTKFVMIAPKQQHEMELFTRIEQEAKHLANLTFIEKVPFTEVQKYFNQAKLFVGTSDYEGFPNTYLQACMGATPIVSLRVNPDDFITKNNLGCCAGGDMEKMKEQIKKLLNGQDDWNEKSKNAFQYVKDNHDIQVVIVKWKKVIDSL